VPCIDFDAARKVLTIGIDFVAAAGLRHRVSKGCIGSMTPRPSGCHLNFFQHECYLEVTTPRVKLADGRVVRIEPDWFGKLSGFTLRFEALVLALAPQMTVAAVARLVNQSWHRVPAIGSRLCRSRGGPSRPVGG
jgi:transposase